MKTLAKTGPATAQLVEAHVPAVTVPAYWAEACKHLVKKDRVMKRLIPQFGEAGLQSRGDAFVTLARSIVGQQISVKAAQSVWSRFEVLPKKLTPANVLKLKVDDMRAAGLSARKVEYLVDLALNFDAGAVHVKNWETMDDEAIIAELIAIRGIGRWTAEMFLIFNLQRPDVLPLDDIGLLRAVALHYPVADGPDDDAGTAARHRRNRVRAQALGENWRPWRSVATWYLWRSLDPVAVEY
jgi:DNA-3-methyladenine glycosylase II